jgi:hypothetical protein
MFAVAIRSIDNAASVTDRFFGPATFSAIAACDFAASIGKAPPSR